MTLSLCRIASAETPTSIDYHYDKTSWADFQPFVPENNEYQLEVGSMWEQSTLSWLGATYGRHLGRCIFSQSQTCQQYLDITGGLGSRQAATLGYILIGPRWQFVNFPSKWSPSGSLFTGMASLRDDERDRTVGLVGAGFGITATVHPRLDLKWEVRFAQSDRFWVESFVAFSFKIDRYVGYFGSQIRNLGVGTVHTTDTIIRKTFSAPKTFMEWFNSSQTGSGSQ